MKGEFTAIILIMEDRLEDIVPRHSEIKEPLARKILKSLGAE